MLNANEISDKIAEYKSLLWLLKQYKTTSASFAKDIVPTVFHQAGSYGINGTDSKTIIEGIIKNAATNAIAGQIKALEGEFKRMKISLEGLET